MKNVGEICYNARDMFTGIVTHSGIIVSKTKSKLQITTDPKLIKKLKDGMSIAVNGICLTVVASDKTTFTIDFMPETVKRTNISDLSKGSLVNLEMPATAETFLAGHIVQGHIDAVGIIESMEESGNSRLMTISVPEEVSDYIVEKGSITVNGVSLTVIAVQSEAFAVGIIPHTWERTMLHTTAVGDKVNIEVDVLAKYIEKLSFRAN